MAHSATLTTRLTLLSANEVDTDRIIVTRYLKATNKNGMGDALLAGWRYNTDGSPKPGFPLNQAQYKGAQVLLAGDNSGCGSLGEPASWALTAAATALTGKVTDVRTLLS